MVVTNKQKFNKKYKQPLATPNSKADMVKLTGIPKRLLDKVYYRGIGAFKTNRSSVRPSVKSKEQWATARLYSFLVKAPGTWGKADKDIADEVRKLKIKGYSR
tara:strand:- start:259 stop:567 length:309 start_codon:yes stop_codon:yes gene_type:complete